MAFLHQSYLLHHGYLVIEEFLFDDFPVLPVSDSAELYLELLPVWRYHVSIRCGHRTLEGSGEFGDRTGPVPLLEENLIGPVSDFIVRKYFKEL